MGWERWTPDDIYLNGCENTEHPLWLDRDQKIASFHEMEHWEKLNLRGDKSYFDFIEGLVENHYRFQ
jgi:hypothetical protein